MGGNCSCEKIASVQEKVNALEKIVSDHTKTSHSIQISRSNQPDVGNSHPERRSLNKSSDSSKRMRTSEVVTITLDDSSDDDVTIDWEDNSSSSNDNILILEQRIRSRKTASRIYSDKMTSRTALKPKTSTMISSTVYSKSN